MKKLLTLMMVLTAIILVSCSKSEENELGSIYGIVTRQNSTEVLKGIQVSLYKGSYNDDSYGGDPLIDYDWTLLLTTTTFDDGHYEFLNLDPGIYGIKISSSSYYKLPDEVVRVEASRQARIDLQY